MLYRSLFLFACLAFLFACSQDPFLDEEMITPTDLQAENEFLMKKGKAVERSFKSKASGEFALIFDGSCGAAPRVVITGDGIGRHTGTFEIRYEFCGGSRMLGSLTAANGDVIEVELLEEVQGPPNPDGSVPVTQTVDVIGGSGRFEGATGGWLNTGVLIYSSVSPPAGTWQLESEGSITY